MLTIDSKSLNGAKLNKQDITKLTGKHTLEIGFFKGATYPSGQSVASVASYQEYGTLRIPARPFFRQAVAKNNKKWLETFKAHALQTAETKALAIVGEIAKGDVQQSITNLRTPPNAPSTIKAKGSTNPLIDTGLMRRSVTYKVK